MYCRIKRIKILLHTSKACFHPLNQEQIALGDIISPQLTYDIEYVFITHQPHILVLNKVTIAVG